MNTPINKKIFITGFSLVTEPLEGIETVKRIKTVLRSEELILSAISEVLKKTPSLKREDIGVVFGSDNAIDACKADYYKGVLADGPLGASPLVFPYTSANAITAQVTIAFGLHHESFTLTDGTLSFLKAVRLAFDLIRNGVCKAVLTGGFSQSAAFAMLMQTAQESNAIISEITAQDDNPAASSLGNGTASSMEETFMDMAALLKKRTIIRVIKDVDN